MTAKHEVEKASTTTLLLAQAAQAAKALAAAAVAFTGGMATASVDGVTQPELWSVIGTTLAAGVAVYAKANARSRH